MIVISVLRVRVCSVGWFVGSTWGEVRREVCRVTLSSGGLFVEVVERYYGVSGVDLY